MPIEQVTVVRDETIPRGEMAFRTLYEAIISNQIRVGEPIREEAAARHLGMSRTPVREALKRLRALGLVKEAGSRGFVITEISKESAIEAFAVREVLETFCARLAAPRVTQRDLICMLTAVDQMEQSKDDAGQASRFDRDFHQCLYVAAGNEVLREIMDGLTRIVDRVPDVGYDVAGRVEQAIAEHRSILAALSAHDSEAAEIATREHLRNGLEARLVKIGSLSERNWRPAGIRPAAWAEPGMRVQE